jgi:ornithine carbamoyltransferase
MSVKHLVSIRDWSTADVAEILRIAAEMKRSADAERDALRGKTLGLLFETPSTRARVSFEVGIFQLGGVGLYLSGAELQLGRGETLADTARVLSRYVDGVVARFRTHAEVVEFSRHATVPVINGFSDLFRPCQALTDYFTLIEKKQDLKGRKIAYVGEGNNMCHSLIYGANKFGMDIAVATPQGLEPKAIIVKSANREAKQSGSHIIVTDDPSAAVEGADAVYTDGWVSMGQEAEAEQKKAALEPYQVNAALMAKAKPDAVFMHCLPAHRDEEVNSEVLDGPQSIVFDQAENRLHVQKALLVSMMRS